MDTPVTIVLGAQSAFILGLVYRLGRYAQRFEHNEERLAQLEAAKTDVALATVGAQLAAVQATMGTVQRELHDLGITIMRWMGRGAASAAAGGD